MLLQLRDGARRLIHVSRSSHLGTPPYSYSMRDFHHTTWHIVAQYRGDL